MDPIITSSRRCVWIAGLLMVLTACGGAPQFTNDRDQVFAQAVEASLEEDAKLASSAAYHYAFTGTSEDPRYDRALRLLALNAERLGLTYAASLWYLDIAQARRDVELAAESIRGLERIVRAERYDQETLLAGFLATAEINGLPPLEQAFVDYLQGLNSMRAGLLTWAEQRFNAIPPSSPYLARARYAQAVRLVALGQTEEALDALDAVLEMQVVPEDVRIDIRRTQARIAFAQERWDDAMEGYEEIRTVAPDDPQLLLEMAWTHYYRGESRRALGLLIALDAPAYRNLIAPERFVLEALALKRLCQFEPARKAAVRLQFRHGDVLEDLYNGVPLTQSKALRRAARLRTGGRDIGRFRVRLLRERRMLDKLSDRLGEGLSERLQALYARGLADAARVEDAQLSDDMEELAQELLEAEEGVRLILHELGVALLRGRRRPEGIQERVSLEGDGQTPPVLYVFDGEFWTDELDDLVVTVRDRCID